MDRVVDVGEQVLDCAYLPGVMALGLGTRADYAALERFHYIPRRPATWAGVWVVRYWDDPHAAGRGSGCTCRTGDGNDGAALAARVVSVAVLSYPVPCLGGRQRWVGMRGWTYGAQLRWANANVRTISRVIVHPQFRGLGLASLLVRHILDDCPTRYVEAVAQMGRAHPFFDQAGMTRVDPVREREGVYFVFDREGDGTQVSGRAG